MKTAGEKKWVAGAQTELAVLGPDALEAVSERDGAARGGGGCRGGGRWRRHGQGGLGGEGRGSTVGARRGRGGGHGGRGRLSRRHNWGCYLMRFIWGDRLRHGKTHKEKIE